MGRHVVTGIRAEESSRRAKRQCYEQDKKHKSKFYVNPILRWSDADVWEFTKVEKIPYCGLYNEGYKRLGCIMCPMSGTKGMLKDAARYPKYKVAYIKAFDRMIEVRKERELETKWINGEEVMDWWIGKKRQPDSLGIFG